MRQLRSLFGPRRALHPPAAPACRWGRRSGNRLGRAMRAGTWSSSTARPCPSAVVSARGGRTVRGRALCGSHVANNERWFGWRLHLTRAPRGARVSFQLLPAASHDLTPLHEAAVALPPGARLIGDTASVSAADAASLLADTGVRLVAARRAKLRPQHERDEQAIRTSRRAMETVHRQAEQVGIQRLHARANAGREGAKNCFAPPVVASLIALAITNADEQSR